MTDHLRVAVAVFFATLILTFGTAIYARIKSAGSDTDEDLAGRRLNKWLIGLSAGTTGNSGFIVTGAVGLGYSGGVHWLLLPLSWLVGDLIFWSLFPHRVNKLSREAQSVTLSEMLTFGITGKYLRLIAVSVASVLAIFLSTYTAAQWLAGEKFLSGMFNMSKSGALLAFGSTIIMYSSIGGFRGSVYVDTLQAMIRLSGTVIALVAVCWYAFGDPTLFRSNLTSAGAAFLNPFPTGSWVAAIGFISGYACAAVGFGLGQPQIVSRYMAGSSPAETKSARWIYIGFLQFTWLSMTAFGVILRGVMPSISDPETGLSTFFEQNIGSVATGIIFADVFATIASTSNGLLVAIAQTIQRDIFRYTTLDKSRSRSSSTLITAAAGVITILLSFWLPGNVFSIAIGAISKIGAGLAGPMMIKLFGWTHDGRSLFLSIVAGIGAAFLWDALKYSAFINEAGIGILTSILVNYFFSRARAKR